VRKGPLLAVLPHGHALAKRRAVPLRALAGEPFVGPPRSAPAFRDALLTFCRLAGFTPDIVQEGNNAQCMLGLVSAGVGVALVPDTFRQFISVEVEFRPLTPRLPPIEFHVAWHRTNESPALQNFLKMLHEQMRQAK
jgi:DNA-binding transcriptional LysR family regulator